MHKTSSDIPHARDVLNEALEGRYALRDAIRQALRFMIRRTPDFRAPSVNKRPSSTIRKAMRAMRRKGYSQLAIARRFNTNQGRVSEAINGLRLKRRGHSRRVIY